MLKEILSVSGRPGLFRLVSRKTNGLIVESLDVNHKRRIPLYASDRVVPLSDISIFTTQGETPLRVCLESLKTHKQGELIPADLIKDEDFCRSTMETILPDYDTVRVYITDIRKLLKWYNILMENNLTDFSEEEESQEETSEGADTTANTPTEA